MLKNNLIFIIPAFPSKDESNSYMVPFIQQFIVGFKENHPTINLTIYTLYNKSKTPYFWKEIEVIPLNFKNNNLFYKAFYILKSVFKIRAKNFDGILSFWYAETAIIGNILKFFNATIHYNWLQGQDVKKSNKFMRYFKPNPKNLIALSNFQNDYLYNTYGFYALKVNGISVNPSFFPKLNTQNRTIDLLGIGSFIPLKNFKLFLEIVVLLKKNNPKIKVSIIGNGLLEKELKEFCVQHKLVKNVTFLGLLSHKETLIQMNNAKVLLHTSNFEGGSAVIHEALYSGCKVVGTLPLIENNQIPFYQCNSKTEITNKIVQLLKIEENYTRFVPFKLKKSTKIIHDLFFLKT